MKKIVSILIALVVAASAMIFLINKYDIKTKYYIDLGLNYIKNIKGVKVPEEYSSSDKNNNGIPDCIDIVNSSRKEAENKTVYKDSYYVGG